MPHESSTPRTDKVLDEHYTPGGPLEDLARRLERELNAVHICVGVASKERGEWDAERSALEIENRRLRSALNRIAMSALSSEAARGIAAVALSGE